MDVTTRIFLFFSGCAEILREEVGELIRLGATYI
jgi:hypothetical protein